MYLFHGSVMGLELVVSYNGIPVEVKKPDSKSPTDPVYP